MIKIVGLMVVTRRVEPRFSILDFVLHILCETKSGTESLASRPSRIHQFHASVMSFPRHFSTAKTNICCQILLSLGSGACFFNQLKDLILCA